MDRFCQEELLWSVQNHHQYPSLQCPLYPRWLQQLSPGKVWISEESVDDGQWGRTDLLRPRLASSCPADSRCHHPGHRQYVPAIGPPHRADSGCHHHHSWHYVPTTNPLSRADSGCFHRSYRHYVLATGPLCRANSGDASLCVNYHRWRIGEPRLRLLCVFYSVNGAVDITGSYEPYM